ncbi:MAG: hypothetical protein AB1918_14960 [Pseudomonadota bacterium]
MSRQGNGRALMSFAVRKDEPARPGEGETIHVLSRDDGELAVSIQRESRRTDGRGGRDMRIRLDRREALALGRHLIAEAAQLSTAKDGASELVSNLTVWNSGWLGHSMVRVTASAIEDELLLSMDRFSDGREGLEIAADISVLFDFEDARSFARAILALTQD